MKENECKTGHDYKLITTCSGIDEPKYNNNCNKPHHKVGKCTKCGDIVNLHKR